MGRKVLCLKKIENVRRCQVTFCKRRSRLIKKANEISVSCDAEVALLAFSPSGRISKFSSPKSIEELIYRYVNLPPDMRFNDMDDVQEKLEKLGQLNHIKGDKRKLYCLDQQLENLELLIKKSTLQIQILETGLRVYEPQEQEPTLDQLLWLENNLRNSLKKVIQRKKVISAGIPLGQEQQIIPMTYKGVTPLINNFSGRDSNSFRGKLPMQLVPHSVEVPEVLMQNRIIQGNRKTMCDQGLAISTSYSTRNNAEKNTFRSAAESYPEIPNRSMFDNGSFIQTLNGTQPSYFERTAHLPLGESIFKAFFLNNGQTGIDKTQTRTHQILPAPGHLNMGVNKHNGNGVMNTTSFYNNNIHNSGITGSGFGIAESNPPQDLLRDDTPGTSYSQVRESGFVDPKYDCLTYKDLKDFLN